MDKKGISIAADWFWKLALLIAVLIIFISVIGKVKDNNLHELRVEAREYAFTRDSLLTTSNSIVYNFKIKENATIDVNPENCLIETKHKGDSVPIRFFCTKSLVQINEQPINNQIRLTKNE